MKRSLILLTAVLALAGCSGTQTKDTVDDGSRTYRFNYDVTITDIPTGSRQTRVWIPVPQSDSLQKISDLKIALDPAPKTGPRQFVDRVWNNKMAYAVYEKSVPKEVHVMMSFTVNRREDSAPLDMWGSVTNKRPTGAEYEKHLTENSMVVINESVKSLAEQALAGRSNAVVDQAQGIYGKVLDHMTYDKSGTGWGRGSVVHACDVGTGNCTDFHSLFMAMSRHRNIASTFEIGFPIPPERGSGGIGGYHCWSRFYVPGKGWVPVDISEADKHPDMAEYFFGNHDVNRVKLSEGRDLTLVPRQAGPPVNFLIYPYVEVDGNPHSGLTKNFSYEDLD